MSAPTPSTDVDRLATTRGFLALALPLAASAAVTWVMHFTNRLFLARTSTDALAASLPAGMLCYTVQSFFISSAGYVGAFAAQHAGAGEDEEAGAMAWPMVWLALVGGVLAAALIPLRATIFGWYGAEPAVTQAMARLGRWYLAETGIVVLFAGLTGWLGGLGRSGTVLALSGLVTAVSIALNYWLVFGGAGVPPLGIDGAGIASVVASACGCATALVIFFSPANRARFGTWRRRNADGRRFARYCRAALPRGATEVLEMVAMVLFTGAVAGLGTAELAANNLALSFYLLVMIPVIGLGQAVTIGVGQAIGAARIAVARAVVRRAFVVAACVLVPAMALFVFAPDALLATHAPRDAGPEALERWRRTVAAARPLMLLCAPMLLADAAHTVWRFAVQGAGDTRWPLIALTTSALVAFAAPSLALTRLVPASTWAGAPMTPLTTCWTLFLAYLLLIAGLMWARYRSGPWARMTLRT